MEPTIIPGDVEAEILVRLPVKSIIRFKSVCKRWCNLIGKQSFITRYNQLSRSQRSKLLCFGKDPITKPLVELSLSKSKLEAIEFELFEDYLELPPIFKDNKWVFKGADTDELIPGCEEAEAYRFTSDIHIVGPVNGIYCIFHRLLSIYSGTLILWNPTTRSYKHVLPPVSFPFPLHQQRGFSARSDDEVVQPVSFHFGFGYDRTINEYKIVVICHWRTIYRYPYDDYWHVRVYNNANDSWTSICSLEFLYLCEGVAFPYIVSEPAFCNNFIHGTCHWSCVERDENNTMLAYSILAFDFVHHSFRIMGGPPISLDRNYPNFIDNKMSVWVFKEETIAFLAMSLDKENIEVWIMKEYGVDDSWNLLVSIATQTLDPEFIVVGILNDERVFLGDNNGRLISYGLFHDNDQVGEHGVYIKPLPSFNGTLGVFNYIESLSLIKTPDNTNNNYCTYNSFLE